MNPGRVIMIAAGAAMAILGLVLDWAKNPAFDGRTGNHPFKYPLGAIGWAVIIVVGVVAALLALGVLRREQAPWPLILVIGAALGAGLLVGQLAAGAGDETFGGQTYDLDPYIGMYVAVGAAAVSLVGAFVDFGTSDSRRTA